MTVTRMTLAALLLTSAYGVSASDLSYTVLDFQALSQTVDGAGIQTPVANQTVAVNTDSGDGVAVAGSLAFGERFYALGAFQTSVIDVDGVITNPLGVTNVSDDFDLLNSRLGLGYVQPLGADFDVVAEITFDSAELDFGGFAGENFDIDDSGVGGRIGFRWNPVEAFELFSYGRYSTVGEAVLDTLEFDSDTLFTAGFRWYFLEDLGLGVEYESGEIETLTISVRFSFGNLPW